jgi:ACS family tartrate transporter-like MFS transporter
MFTWGIISALFALATGPISFLVLRFLLGAAEAGFLPGVILYFTYWFPGAWRARVIAGLFIAIPAGNAVGAVLSGAIMGHMDGVAGLRNWQWLFLIEAAPALVLAFVVLRFLTERPGVAAWLTRDEREWLEGQLQAERATIERAGRITMWQSLGDRRVLALALIYFAGIIASYGMTFYLPQIVDALGHSNFVTGLLVAVPYVIGVVGLLIFGYSSDRRRERRWHLIGASMIAAVGLVAVGALTRSHWAILAMSVAAVGIYGARPAFWPLPSQFLTGGAAAAGIALINAVGNLGGYLGPFVVGWIRETTKSFEMGLYFLGACAFLSGIIAAVAVRATGGQTARPS